MRLGDKYVYIDPLALFRVSNELRVKSMTLFLFMCSRIKDSTNIVTVRTVEILVLKGYGKSKNTTEAIAPLFELGMVEKLKGEGRYRVNKSFARLSDQTTDRVLHGSIKNIEPLYPAPPSRRKSNLPNCPSSKRVKPLPKAEL